MSWLDFLKALPPFITAGAAVFGAYTAFQGLQKWRQETVGKRKMELAEDVLVDFYEARDIVNAARSPGGFANEGATRTRSEDESDDDRRMLDAYYAVAERLFNRADFFARLEGRRYRFIAHFGPASAEPFEKLRRIHLQILAAVNHLSLRYRASRNKEYQGQFADLENVIWDTLGKDDHIRRKLDAMVEDIEKSLSPSHSGRH
jgi:hypothetical protein